MRYLSLMLAAVLLAGCASLNPNVREVKRFEKAMAGQIGVYTIAEAAVQFGPPVDVIDQGDMQIVTWSSSSTSHHAGTINHGNGNYAAYLIPRNKGYRLTMAFDIADGGVLKDYHYRVW